MSIDPISGFEIFNPVYGHYPSPKSEVKLGTTTFPTNSWFQNAITDSVDNANRFGNAIPWMWLVNYDTGTFGLAHMNRTVFTNTTTNGNLQQIETQGNDITVFSNHGHLNLTQFDDYTAKFNNSDNSFYALPSRGSPFATFVFNNKTASVSFNSFPITNLGTIGSSIIVETQSFRTTNTNAGFDNPGSLTQTLTTLSFFDGYTSLNKPVTATLTYNSPNQFNGSNSGNPTPSSLTINALGVVARAVWSPGVNNPNVAFTFNPPGSGTGMSLSNTAVLIKYTGSSTELYSIIVDANWPNLPHIATATYAKLTTWRWMIHGPPTMTRSGNLLTAPNYTGSLQIAAIDPDSDILLYANYVGSYLTKGSSSNYGPNGGFNINYERVGANQLLLLPNHWNSFNISGMTPVSALAKQNIIYGDLSFWSVSSNTLTLSPKSFVIPPVVNLSGFSTSQKNALATQVIADAAFLANRVRNFIPASDPYSFGQAAAAVGRLFLFAKELNILTNPAVSEAIGVVQTFLIAWMSNTNVASVPPPPSTCTLCPTCVLPKDVFHLQRETRWGGIIVPADYLLNNNPACYGVGSFGNSYYNDHHFHWGYILYALYCLEYVGQGISASYPRQIKAIIQDLVNPVVDTVAWKTRYKDWYAGHSWATGNTTEVARQQESSSEAINGYYGAYLMSGVLGETTLQNVAATCLNLEIQAAQNYYYLLAPGSKLGLMTQVKGAGILFNNSKQFTLDWGMQPDSFNARALGIYGIQTVPFTDIALIQIPTSWAASLATSNSEVGFAYSITSDLVTGLNATTYEGIPVYDTQWKVNADKSFNVQQEGTYWGFVGLKMLSFAKSQNVITNIAAQQAYANALAKQKIYQDPQGLYFPIVKGFDSFSNTLYWLTRNGQTSSFGTDFITIGEITTPSQGCTPLTLPTKQELLNNSPLKSQCLIEAPLLLAKVCFNQSQDNPVIAYFLYIDNREYYDNKPLTPPDCSSCILGNSSSNSNYIQGTNYFQETSYLQETSYSDVAYNPDCYECRRHCCSLHHSRGCCKPCCKPYPKPCPTPCPKPCPYPACSSCDGCLTYSIRPEEVRYTQITTTLDPTTMVNALGTTIIEKAANIGGTVTAAKLLGYAYLKLSLSKPLFGTVDLKFLSQAFNDEFFTRLANSKFCNFINAFEQGGILDYNQYFLPI
jgi:hypothetical protein